MCATDFRLFGPAFINYLVYLFFILFFYSENSILRITEYQPVFPSIFFLKYFYLLVWIRSIDREYWLLTFNTIPYSPTTIQNQFSWHLTVFMWTCSAIYYSYFSTWYFSLHWFPFQCNCQTDLPTDFGTWRILYPLHFF